MRFASILLVVLAAGCGAGKREPLSVDRDGRAVLQDVHDGHLDRRWSCGSLRAAYRRLPVDGPVYSPIPALIGDAAGSACDDALEDVRKGTTRARVAFLLGRPDRRPRCWLFRWPPGTDAAQDGARICFEGDRVATIQIAVHG